ncbi:MAG: TerC family protein [Acidobacteriota bacterium]
MEWLADPQAWIALITLTALEIVLGIDNIVFITILAGRLPEEEQQKARMIGLALALIMRVGLLASLAWIITLTEPLFHVLGNGLSGRDLILLGGGMFLLGKSTLEIHHELEEQDPATPSGPAASLGKVLVNIVLLDIVFSLDSVITAVGMADELGVMITAVILAVAFMMVFAKPIGSFVEERPTVKMLALSFLLLIGTALIADGLDLHIPKGYIYFAMAFALFVEMLNLRLRSRRETLT